MNPKIERRVVFLTLRHALYGVTGAGALAAAAAGVAVGDAAGGVETAAAGVVGTGAATSIALG